MRWRRYFQGWWSIFLRSAAKPTSDGPRGSAPVGKEPHGHDEAGKGIEVHGFAAPPTYSTRNWALCRLVERSQHAITTKYL